MPPASASVARASVAADSRRARESARPFFGLIDPVLVDDDADFEFDGSIARAHALAVWTWMRRDLGADLIDADTEDGEAAAEALEAQMPELLRRAATALSAVATSHEAERRLRTQLGGEEPWLRLPVVLQALKCRKLLAKAKAFGRATNGLQDEAALAQALQSMPLQDRGIAALLMQATIAQISHPSRLMNAVIRIAGSPKEEAIARAGFAPLVEAILSHAQSQIPALVQIGPFADIDLICRAIHRFHRLIRAISSLVELERKGRWAMIVSALTKQVSDRVEPRLREVTADVNKALRRNREGIDRLDSDHLLSALNGVYILATMRDCRESLALNALFDQTWSQVGQALEVHIQRHLELLRQNPSDSLTAERLDTAIKMAELRFNAEYAEVLRRAKEAVVRR